LFYTKDEMPELPDIENFVQYFKYTSLHKKVEAVKCGDEDLIKNTTSSGLGRALKGKQFINAYRRGKFLITEIKDSDYKLVFHFGMTGYFRYGKPENADPDENKHAYLIISLRNGYELRWINIRKLGEIYLVKNIKEVPLIKNMGPEPLKISKKEFFDILKDHEIKNIKSFLMDQKDIAGIGNEYSDEILFRAHIDPHRKIKSLSKKERKKLYNIIQDTLKRAIDAGPPYGKMNSSWLVAHRKDMVCPKNKKHKLVKEKIAGRSAIFCPEHQS